jgi:hypothetical protein
MTNIAKPGATATKFFNIGRKEKDVHNLKTAYIHISSFIKIFSVLFALSPDQILWKD